MSHKVRVRRKTTFYPRYHPHYRRIYSPQLGSQLILFSPAFSRDHKHRLARSAPLLRENLMTPPPPRTMHKMTSNRGYIITEFSIAPCCLFQHGHHRGMSLFSPPPHFLFYTISISHYRVPKYNMRQKSKTPSTTDFQFTAVPATPAASENEPRCRIPMEKLHSITSIQTPAPAQPRNNPQCVPSRLPPIPKTNQ